MVSPRKSRYGDLHASQELVVVERSAARTSGMGAGLCLRGTTGWRSKFLCSVCHSRTLENEGQSTSRVSGFYHCWEKDSNAGSIPAPLKVTG